MKEKIFVNKLIQWWAENKRDFAWRNTQDPYKILLAEVMLRKTTAGQVAKLYKRFLLKYPGPSSLLAAPIRELKKDLKPLGMYKVRAMQLRKMAKILVHEHGARVPRSKERLMALPGVKEYCANAVLCLAYGKSVMFLDTNSARVLQRVFGIKTTRKVLPQDDPKLWRLAAGLIPPGKAKEFNLALLDFGAKICTSLTPRCSDCPIIFLCKTKRNSM